MRLLYTMRGLKNGGIATSLISRLNYLAENTNFDLHILLEFHEDYGVQEKIHPRVRIHYLPIMNLLKKKRLPIIGYFTLLNDVKREYQKFVNSLRPDIITSFNYGYNSEIIPYLKTNAKKIVEFRGSYASKSMLKKKKDVIDYFKKNEEYHHNKYDVALMLTGEDLRDRRYLNIEKYVIYNEILPPVQFTPFTDRKNIILGVGTLTHNKNFIDLVSAINLIKDSLGNWVVHIYGEGTQKEFLQEKLKEYGLERAIELKGFCAKMDKVYNDSKILVSTSFSEGMPRNLLEAKKYKIPIISYDCKCGPKEIISNNINGFLIDFDTNTLAEKIKLLIEQPLLLEEFSNRSYDDIRKFEHSTIMKQWEQFYELVFAK